MVAMTIALLLAASGQAVGRDPAAAQRAAASASAAQAAAQLAAQYAFDAMMAVSNAAVAGTDTLVTPVGTTTPQTLGALTAQIAGSPGAVLYVKSDTGSDANTCLSWAFACKTLLGAYDKLTTNGGEIRFADNAWVGGEVANQGLWFVGTNDATYSSPLPGFRVQKPVRFVGVGGKLQGQFGRPACAQIIGGHGEGWARDRSKPAIHLAGTFSPFVFENAAVVGATRSAVVGIAADLYPDSVTLTGDGSSVEFMSPIPLYAAFGLGTYVTPLTGNTDPIFTYPGAVTVTTGAVGVAKIHFNNGAPENGRQFTISRPQAMAATDWFVNPLFQVMWTATDSGIDGPVMDVGYAFWLFVDDSTLLAYDQTDDSLPKGDDRHQAVRIVGSGLQWFRRGIWAQGGVVSYFPGISVEDVIVESSYKPIAPAVWLKNCTTSQCYAYIRNVSRSDAVAGDYPADVQVEGATSTVTGIANNVVVEGFSSVKGPATIFGGNVNRFANGLPNNRGQQQLGIMGGRVWARQESARRMLGPTTVFGSSRIKASFDPTASITTVATVGPDYVTSSATRVYTDTGGVWQGYTLSTSNSVNLNVGDRIYFGAWTHDPSGIASSGFTGSLNMAVNQTNVGLDNGGSYKQAAPIGDGSQWSWVWDAATVVTTHNAGSTSIDLNVYMGNGYPVDVYLPTLFVVPAGTYSENEWGEIVEALAGWKATAPTGSRAVDGTLAITSGNLWVRGNRMDWGSAAPSTGMWARGDVVWNTGATAGGAPGWVCTSAGTPGTWKAMGNLAP